MSLAKLKIEVDTHTHSVLSGHAWSTIIENATYGKKTGLKKICVTEHAPNLLGTAPYFFVQMMRVFPEKIEGVDIVPGLEFNIIDFEGTVDVTAPYPLSFIKWGIASMHDICIKQGTLSQHTDAYIGALANPYIDILGHPGTAYFSCDIEKVVCEAKKKNKMIEINNNSFVARAGGRQNCINFAKQCIKQDVRICVASDAHIAFGVGQVGSCLEMLTEINFPSELILNKSAKDFDAYLNSKK